MSPNESTEPSKLFCILSIIIDSIIIILILGIVILSWKIERTKVNSFYYIIQLLFVNWIQAISYLPKLFIELGETTEKQTFYLVKIFHYFLFIPAGVSSIIWISILAIKTFYALSQSNELIDNPKIKKLFLFLTCYFTPLSIGAFYYCVNEKFQIEKSLLEDFIIVILICCGIVISVVFLIKSFFEIVENQVKGSFFSQIKQYIINVAVFCGLELICIIVYAVLIFMGVKTFNYSTKGMIFGIKGLIFPIVYLIFGLNKEVIEDALNTSKLSRKEISLQNMEKSFCEDDDGEQNDEDCDQSRL